MYQKTIYYPHKIIYLLVLFSRDPNILLFTLLFVYILPCFHPITMEAPFHVNSLNQLWPALKALWILQHSFSKLFKPTNITIVQVPRSMEDEQTSSTFSFMKSKLKNHVNEHWKMFIGMYYQTFFALNTFLYNMCFNDWKELKPCWTLDYILMLHVACPKSQWWWLLAF